MLATLLLAFSLAAHAGEPSIANDPRYEEKPVVEAPPEGWWTVDGPLVDVHGDRSDDATVRHLADHAARSVPALAARMGVAAGRHVDVFVAPTQAAFDDIQPGAPPDWADGTAWPRAALIFLRSPSIRDGTATPLETVLDHELVHVLLGSAFGTRPVPRWLQEGLAQYYAGEIGPDLPDRISEGLLGSGLLHLEDLVHVFPQNPSRARLAYAQSADFVSWLSASYGEGALRTVIARLAAGESVDVALREATGTDLHSLDDEWRGRLTGGTMWARAIGKSGLLWFVAIGAMFIGWSRRRRRNAERRRRMEEQEAREDAWLAAERAAAMRRSVALPPPPDRWVH